MTRNYIIAVMFGIFLIILLPVPVILLDIFISLNILLSSFLLYNTYSAKKLEDNYLLPNIVICFVFSNLITTIAVTRLILTKGFEFDAILIGGLASFISVYNAASLIPAIIIFCLIICFLLKITGNNLNNVTKMIANFSFDSVPAKLQAIEKDLENRKILPKEAIKRKNAVNAEVDFYTEINEAAKFANSNKMMILIIIAFTFIIGIFYDIRFRKEEIEEVLPFYISVIIPAGLFSMLPSLILSKTILFAIKKL